MKLHSILLIFLCFLGGCTGFRYSLVEDDNRYLLVGEFYNNNPFIAVKAHLPDNFIVEKSKSQSTDYKNIYNFRAYNMGDRNIIRSEDITGGYIIDHGSRVEIKLNKIKDYDGTSYEAMENGTYALIRRSSVENLCEYIQSHYSWLSHLDSNKTKCGMDDKDS